MQTGLLHASPVRRRAARAREHPELCKLKSLALAWPGRDELATGMHGPGRDELATGMHSFSTPWLCFKRRHIHSPTLIFNK